MIGIEPRPYRDHRDLVPMMDILIKGRMAGGPTYYVHVGDLQWWLFYLNRDDDLRQTIYLWEGECAGGDLIGWSLFSPKYRAFDVYVHPEKVGSQHAEQIWSWTQEKMAEIVRKQDGKDVRAMWVSEHDADLIDMLEHRGFVCSEHHLICLVRSLESPIHDISLPPGYRVRPVKGEREATQRAAVAHAAFESRRSIEYYEQNYRAFMQSPVYNPDLDLVVIAPDGRFAALCICWLDTVNKVGLFEPVGTGPDFRRKGLGKAILVDGLRRMKAQGMESAMVCVEYDNPGAQRLYAAVGFRAAHRLLTFTKGI